MTDEYPAFASQRRPLLSQLPYFHRPPAFSGRVLGDGTALVDKH